MKLYQYGPEQDPAGELDSTLLTESDDIDNLLENGRWLAADLGVPDALWFEFPLHSKEFRMKIRDDVYLRIDPRMT